MKTQNSVLNEIVSRIVEVADPEEIILFGSGAREEMEKESDLDLLVIKPGVNRRQLAQDIYMNLFGVEQPVDIVVVTPEDIERYKDSNSLILKRALEEGKVLYDKESKPQTTG